MKTKQQFQDEAGRLRWFYWGFIHARHNMPSVWRATFLIFAIGPVVHSPWAYTLFVYAGYLVCAILDQRSKDNVVESETDWWEADPSDSESESNGNLCRVKLTGQNQIVWYRVATLLGRLP